MDDKTRIEQAISSFGFVADAWFTDEDGKLTAALGTWMVRDDTYEDVGLYAEDVGELTAVVVGAEKYGNQRVMFNFVTEDNDEGNEVRDPLILEPVTD